MFEVFNAFLMKTALFCFDSFSLPVSGSGNTKIKRFQFPEFGLFGRQYEPPDIEIFLHSISIPTKPNDLPPNLHTLKQLL